MANGSYFTDFKYKSFFSPLKKKVCIEVSFFYNNKPIKRFIFIDKDSNVDYVQEAKRIIKQEIESGKLEKYCKHYGHSIKPLLITALTATSLVVVAGAGYLGYKYLAPGGGGGGGGGETSFTASIAMSESITGYSVSLTNEKVIKGDAYSSTIQLHYPTGQEPTYVLPSKLEKVKVGGQEISDSVYTYTYKSIEEAGIVIPAESVTGKVEITIKLAERPTPVVPISITGEGCEGCTIPKGQTVNKGSNQFTFNIKFISGYSNPQITALRINEIPIDVSKIMTAISGNEIQVTLPKDKTVDGDVVVTVVCTREGDKTITLNSSSLSLCDINDQPFSGNTTRFDSGKDCIVRIERPDGGKHVPLDITVTPEGGTPLSFGTQYKYRFLDDEVAELVIPAGIDANIAIDTSATEAVAQFIYKAPANTEECVTFAFLGEGNFNSPRIDWGDDSESESSYCSSEKKICHPFKNETDDDKFYIINMYQESQPTPNTIGLDVGVDIRSSASNYPYIASSIDNVRYASGTKNIKAARLTKMFTALNEEGLSHTSIDSFCIPSEMSIDSIDFALCSNLDEIYVASNNMTYMTSEDHKILFSYSQDVAGGVDVEVTANSSQVELDKCGEHDVVGIKSFAAAGRTLSQIHIKSSVDSRYIKPGALACCTINDISVDTNNTLLFDEGGKHINMLVGCVNAKYNVISLISESDISYLNRISTSLTEPLTFESYSISGDDVPLSDIGEKSLSITPNYVVLNPNTIYHTTGLEKVSFMGTELASEGIDSPIIYDCDDLTSVTFDSITNDNVVGAGIIQKCPNVTTLAVTNFTDLSYYGAGNNTIYYADGKKQGAAIVAGTCSTSRLADPETTIDWYIKDFAPYVFNGNAFGTNCGEGVTSFIYITKNVTNLSIYSGVGMSDNAKNIYFTFDSSNPYYRAYKQGYTEEGRDGYLHTVTSADETNKSLHLAVLENLNTLKINVSITNVSPYCMVNDPTITKIEVLSSEYMVRNKMSFEDNAFYNCPNLRTIDLSSLPDGVVPTITSTNAFVQEECTPFTPKDITVKVKSVDLTKYTHHEYWQYFNIVPV